jgi:hypothetical protein
MLRDIAALLAEIVVERFAASEQFFEPEPSTDPVTAYQQFAFLRALLTGPEFVAAIARVLSVPNRRWLQIEETRPLAIGLKPDPWLVKAISATGERQPYLNPDIKGLSSLPTRVNAMSFAETLDTPKTVLSSSLSDAGAKRSNAFTRLCPRRRKAILLNEELEKLRKYS